MCPDTSSCPRTSPSLQKELSKWEADLIPLAVLSGTGSHSALQGATAHHPHAALPQRRVAAGIKAMLPVDELRVCDGPSHALGEGQQEHKLGREVRVQASQTRGWSGRPTAARMFLRLGAGCGLQRRGVPCSLSCRTGDQAAQGSDEPSSARQGCGECAGLLASRPSIAWLSLKSKAGASDTNCFLYAGSCRVQPCGNGKHHREPVPIRAKSITLSTFEFQRKSGREKTKPAPRSQEGPGAKQVTWNRHHRRRKGASHPRHVVQPVLPPGERPRKGKIQQQKPSLPTSGNSSWVPSTRGCQGRCSQKGSQTRGVKTDLPEGSTRLQNRSREEPRNLVLAILIPCAAQSCWKCTTEKQSSRNASSAPCSQTGIFFHTTVCATRSLLG